MTNTGSDILLDELIAEGRESPWLEFKHNSIDESRIGEYVSALANSAALHDRTAGYIVWGVRDTDLKIVGTDFDIHKARVGQQPLLIHLANQLEPRVTPVPQVLKRDGCTVVILQVPAAASSPVSYSGKRFIRIGESVTTLQGRPEESVLFSKLLRMPFETSSARSQLSESEVLDLLDYPAYFKLMKSPLPSDRATILQRLEQERLIQRVPSGWVIRNLAALLFAPRLSRFEGLARKAARAVVYAKDDRTVIRRQNELDVGYAVGFEGFVRWIRDQLPQNTHIGEAFREERPMYPEVALRELVANALIHQDFTISGAGPLVEIFPTRIEFTNPGKPLIASDRFLDLPPTTRNEHTAGMMRRMGMCEELGSGIDRVLDLVEFYQLPAPDFAVHGQVTRVTLFAHRAFIQMTKEERVRAAYQHAALMHITNRFMTNASLRKRLDISAKNYPQVSLVIRDAVKDGWILREGPIRHGPGHAKYVPYWASSIRDNPSATRRSGYRDPNTSV